ncbi:YCF48-related protein [Flavobacterium johnsoniae]|uniref:YCF48-related protein n=1 Tax=Flavobacterium johnsoniae TaxID=986 RepID=UPI0025B098B0|nr:YCF48-related protein [Flavobacterium johnsoniae]WJS93068.1 YCF48-related protein [Flavobacterium johnsoniae]
MARTLHSITLFFITFFFTISLYSQKDWELLNPKPSYKKGLDIQFVTDKIGYVINNTEILETLDGGVSWKKTRNINASNDLSFFNEIGYIVGDNGYVLKSENSGAEWTSVTTGFTGKFNTVNVISKDVVIISSDNTIVKTIDGGLTWKQLIIPNVKVNKTFFTTSLVGHAVCNNGTILKTKDGGVSWYKTATDNVIPSNYFTVYFINENIGFASREHSYLYKTVDGGETWTNVKGSLPAFYTFSFLDENVGYAGGEHGAIFKTIDGGLTWTWASFQNAYIASTEIYGIHFLDHNTGFATGATGRIVKTIDGGKNWSQNSPTHNDINKLEFLTKDLGYARVGNSFYKTIDSGNSWKLAGSIDNGTYNYYVTSSKFLNENVGYAVTGSLGYIYKTVDGGVTWKKLGGDNLWVVNEGINTMSVISEKIIYISGGFNQRSFMKSVDGGETWTILSNYNFYRMQFLDENIGYAHNTYDKKVYKTIDGGKNWSVVFTGDQGVKSIDFLDQYNGYVIGDNAMMYKTINGGASWEKITIPYEYYTFVKFYTQNVGYIFDEEGSFYKTENGGKSWKSLMGLEDRASLKAVAFNDDSIYAYGGYGKIFKSKVDFAPYFLNLDPAVDVHNRSANLPGNVISNDGEITNVRLEVLRNKVIIKTVQIDPDNVKPGSSLSFKVPVLDLIPDTFYEYRIVAVRNNSEIYSQFSNFRTAKNFKFTINPVTDINPTSVFVAGSILSEEGDITEIEIEYSNKQDFSDYKTFKTNVVVKGNTSEDISTTLSDLNPKTLYYVRLKGFQEGTKIYSDIISFQTKSEYEINIYFPYETTDGAVLNAYLISNEKDITNVVFEYGELNFDKSIAGTPDKILGKRDSFVSGELKNLDKTKAYFYRVKAIYGDKVIYSKTEILNYSRKAILFLETANSNQNGSVELKGIINAAGNYLTNLVFEYGTTENFGSSIQTNPSYVYGTSTLNVSATIQNVTANQKYYYRLKANMGGTFLYSNTLSFINSNLDVNDFNYEKNILLFPNPTKDVVNIKLIDNKKIAALKVIDQSGNVLSYEKDVRPEETKIIDFSDKSTGVYYIQFILDDNSKINKKVIRN